MEELKAKGIDELCEWLGGQPEMKDKAGKLEKACRVIKEQEIDGDAFLACTQEEWERWTLPGGVAKTLVQIAERVKKESIDEDRFVTLERLLVDFDERKTKKQKMHTSKPLVETSGCDFIYSDRNYSLKKLVECLEPRFKAWVDRKQDRNLHPIPFLADGPGTGKSRFLQELPLSFRQHVSNSTCSDDFKNIVSNAIYINITFGNGSAYTDEEVSIGINKSLSLRILHSFDDSLVFSNFMEAYSSENVKFAGVLSKIGKDFSCIVLGIDEINQVSDINPHQFKELFRIIGALSCSFKPFFVPIFAGTVIGSIRSVVSKSTHPPFHVPLPLLTYESCLDIISQKNSLLSYDVKNNKYLKTLIFDMGGHCRALEILYDVLMKGYNPASGNYWNNVSIEVRSRMIERYPMILSIPLSGVIALSFLMLPVGDHTKLPDCEDLTFLELSEKGIVKLEDIGAGQRRVRIPYVFVCCHLGVANTKTSFSNFWKDILLDQDFWWQDWEVFNRNHLAFRLSLYSYLGYTKISLSQFLSGAKLSGLLDIKLIVPSLDNILTDKIDFRFPLTKKPHFEDGSCILNGSGAPFEAFVFLSTDSERILIALQMKFSHVDSKNPQKITNESINTEYLKVYQNVSEYIKGTNFLLLMCGRCQGVYDITTLPGNIAIVSDSEFECFYGNSYYKRLCIFEV